MTLFVTLLALTAVTRLFELNLSRRHRLKLLAMGAAPAPDPGYLGMVLLHTGILVGSFVEALVLGRSVSLFFGISGTLVVLFSGALRIWAISSLGQHWNVRVIDSTSLGVVENGPYRFIRHPNYVAVFLELAFLPLAIGAWLTASLGTTLHLLVLHRRIHHEENVLMRSGDYRRAMADKPRFIPALFQVKRSTYPAQHS